MNFDAHSCALFDHKLWVEQPWGLLYIAEA